MSEIRIMAKQSTHYFLGYAGSIIASFISFPIYTRIFSLNDYGLMSIITTTVFFVMAIGKFGLQNSIIRFYDEIKNGKKALTLSEYYSTLYYGPIIIIFVVCLIYVLGIPFLRRFFKDPSSFKYLLLSAIWAFFQCSNIIIKNFLRVEQNTFVYNLLNLITKYSYLILSLVLILLVFKNLTGLYLAFIITEISIFIYLYKRYKYIGGLSFNKFNKDFFKECLIYSIPLVGMELTNILLNAADRYVIMFFKDPSSVGLYSAGYDLSAYAIESIVFPLSFTITPLYMKIWMEKGKDHTSEFLSKVLRFFMMVALPCLLGFNYLGRDITVLLASKKFEQAYKVMPYISCGYLFFGLTNIFNAGLLINKKTHILAIWTIITGIFNLILNIILVPKYGFVGAAFSTLISYLLLLVGLSIQSFSYLSFKIEFWYILKYLILAIFMIEILHLFKTGSLLLNIILKMILGALIYAILVLICDREIRLKLRDYLVRYKFLGFINI